MGMIAVDKLASFVVVWIGVFVVETLLLGSYGTPGFLLKGFVAVWPATWAARQEWPILTFLAEGIAEGRSPQAVGPAKTTIRVFGEEIERPAFLTEMYQHGVPPFWATVYWEGKSDRIVTGRIQIADAKELTQRRMLEAMIESARLLRFDRGHPLSDRLNNTIWPEVYPQGILVEEIENDDGTTSAILAIGIKNSLSRQEWANAEARGFGRYLSAWDEHPRIKAKVEKQHASGHWKLESSSIPLFHLALTEIVIPAMRPSDALGGPGVTVDHPAELRRD